jgi:hypothetical protein
MTSRRRAGELIVSLLSFFPTLERLCICSNPTGSKGQRILVDGRVSLPRHRTQTRRMQSESGWTSRKYPEYRYIWQ